MVRWRGADLSGWETDDERKISAKRGPRQEREEGGLPCQSPLQLKEEEVRSFMSRCSLSMDGSVTLQRGP
ncbi:hypothetical protein NSK_006128 [Nannochloropsis salina CCMP1776]|uniref:Uncharacterized protein n=1 Tax=Nannochloropsis salina CCMP1776 TaxID=1027361 RepID=A0A4D9CVT6_9STRA|nr:hypothetical protein NSK_006128 [Nannochloropsis salina CCMP1776]|eukprot:TFJ82704.1 hypothetical protein NSK_006128 [Nannochloropsis salina CCMP1776]